MLGRRGGVWKAREVKKMTLALELLVSQQPLSKLLLAHNPLLALNLPVVVLAAQAG